jgi:heme oxygenase
VKLQSISSMMQRIVLLLGVYALCLFDYCAAFARPARHETSLVADREWSRLFSTASKTDINPRLIGLALLLDDGTRKSHSIAQNSAFVSGFFKGLSTREAYRALLTSLYFVYKSMEESFDQTNECRVQALDDSELRRLTALERDMDFFYGTDWRSLISPSPATKMYVERVKQVADKTPYLLVAHQYTRYLGDLFGGQMMSGMATRSLDLKDDKGVDFYKFKDIYNVKDFITCWYQKLNDLEFTQEEKQKIVDEANLVFDLNVAILEELEGSPFRALWTLAINTMKLKLGMAE